MKLLKVRLIVLGSLGLIGLGACSNSDQAANPDNSPNVVQSAQSPAQSSSPSQTESNDQPGTPQEGGQVVESGPYHLEFVPEPEVEGTHMDFFLQRGDNHEAIPNAIVTAQVQLPDGTQKTLPLTYDNEGKHYTAMLPGKADGQYQVKITSDIKGEKVDGRFTFNQ